MNNRYNPLAAVPSARPSFNSNSKRTRKAKPAEPDDAVRRIREQESQGNYPSVYEGFIAKGLAREEIQPRVNVLTFNAWKALGRIVKKGEHGVRICTIIPLPDKSEVDPVSGAVRVLARSRRRIVTVFHISQTEKLIDTSAAKPKRTPEPLATVLPVNFRMAKETVVPVMQSTNIVPMSPSSPVNPNWPSWRARLALREAQKKN